MWHLAELCVCRRTACVDLLLSLFVSSGLWAFVVAAALNWCSCSVVIFFPKHQLQQRPIEIAAKLVVNSRASNEAPNSEVL